jgi:esterase/lipase
LAAARVDILKENNEQEKQTPEFSLAMTRTMALAAWDLERIRTARQEGPRSRVIYLRTYKRLQNALDDQRGIPAQSRGVLDIQEGAPTAGLLIHDIGALPTDMADLAHYLWQGGMTVYAPPLNSSGMLSEESAELIWKACYQDIRQRFRLLRRVCRHVYVVGVGFGAALAIHLARREQVAALALLAPGLIPRVNIVERTFLRLKLHRLRWLRPRLGWSPEILEAMESARVQVSRLRIPIYAAHCEDDERISPISLRVLQKRARHSASRFRVFPTGGHDILRAHGEASLHVEIKDFFRSKD